MTQIVWIARHANRIDFVKPEWFLTAERRYDPPLSDDGMIQAQQLAERLKMEKIDCIFTSPFLRTVQTANAVAVKLDLSIKLETGLSEWLNSDWMSEEPKRLTIRALAKLFPRIDASYTPIIAATYPETQAQTRKRSGLTARCLAAEHFPKHILLVGHGTSVKGAVIGLVGDIADDGEKVRLCSLFKAIRQDPGWLLELRGDNSHLTHVEEVVRFN